MTLTSLSLYQGQTIKKATKIPALVLGAKSLLIGLQSVLMAIFFNIWYTFSLPLKTCNLYEGKFTQ